MIVRDVDARNPSEVVGDGDGWPRDGVALGDGRPVGQCRTDVVPVSMMRMSWNATKRATVAGGAIVVATAWLSPVLAAPDRDPVAEADRLREAPEPLEGDLHRAIALYEKAARLHPTSADIQVKLAEAAMSMGAWETGDPLRWYTLGAQAGERAVVLDPTRADAHFLLAAHRGQIAKRQRNLRGLAVPGELEQHLLRALALDPRHPRALHMMGALLRDTPLVLRGSLTGRRADIERYLVGAVDADPEFAEARLDLAKHYRDTGKAAEARRQAEAVVRMTPHTRGRAWRETYRPAAEALLKELAAQ